MAQSDRTRKRKSQEEFHKNVILLKHGDFQRINGHACLPNSIEMSNIKTKAEQAQFKKAVEFASSMPPEKVKKKLEETFPYLKNRSFSCGAVVKVDNDHSKFEFHGSPHLWDGKTIKKRIKGNSALYILEDEVSQPTSKITHNIHPADLNPCKMMHTTSASLEGEQALLYQEIAEMSILSESPMEVDENQQGVPGYTYDGHRNSLHHTGVEPDSQYCNMSIASTSGEGHSTALPVSEWNVTTMPDLQHQEFIMMPSSTAPSVSTDTAVKATGSQEEISSSDEGNSSAVSTTSAYISDGDGDHSEEVQYELYRVKPNRVPLRGGYSCQFYFKPKRPEYIFSGVAHFKGVGKSVPLDVFKDDSLVGEWIPPSPCPGLVEVTVECGMFQWKIWIEYYDDRKDCEHCEVHEAKDNNKESYLGRILNDEELQARFFEMKAAKLRGKNSSGGNQNSRDFVQELKDLIYTAAETGAQQFLEMLFATSAGTLAFDAYKDSLPLPEVVAMNHGHEKTARYLEDVTARFSKEATAGAGDATQMQLSQVGEEENDQLTSESSDTDYFGDVETSSSKSSQSAASDSDDDVSEVFSKEENRERHSCLNEGCNSLKAIFTNDQTSQHASHQPIVALCDRVVSFVNEGLFPRKQVNAIGRPGTNKVNLKENCVQISKWFDKEELDLQQLRSLHHPQAGICVLLSIGAESIPRHLSTMYDRWGNLLQSKLDSGERTTQWVSILLGKMHLEPASDQLSLTCPDVMDSVADSEGCLTSNNVDPLVKWEALECSTEQCYCSTSDVWVLTNEFRPTRKILFIYLAATNCPSLHFYNGTACTPCSRCPLGFGLKTSCSEKEDTKCEACWPQYDYSNSTGMEPCIMCDQNSNCLPGNARIVKNCTVFAPTVCQGCAEGSYFDPDVGMNGGCIECSPPCGYLEMETRSCQTEHDRKCSKQKKENLPSVTPSQPPSATVDSIGTDSGADGDEDDDDNGVVTPTPDLIREHPLHKKTWFWLVIAGVVIIPAVVTTATVRYRKRHGRHTTDRIDSTPRNEIIRQQMSPLMPRDGLNLPVKYLTIEQKRFIANMLNDKDSYGFFYWERTAEKVGLGAESRAWKRLDNPTESFLRSYGEKAGSTVTTLIEALRGDGLTHFADQIETAFSSTSQDHGETERVAETPV